METLILKKECKGYYSNMIDNIKISVSEYNGEWTGLITNENEIEDNKYILYKTYSNLKKQVINDLVKFLKQC